MKNDRHSTVEVFCEVCGTIFLARAERVKSGMGKYCSRACSHEGRRIEERKKWGRKDLAKAYKIGGKYCARWYDENGKTCSTTYQRWWWETNVGEIPDGMIVLLKDNNPMNIDPSNFELGTKLDSTNKGKKTLRNNPKKWREYLEKGRERMKGFRHTEESKKKLSDSHKGKHLTLKHKNNISLSLIKRWRRGDFDLIHKGRNHKDWKDNKTKHPKEFNEELKDFIRERDNNVCQICGRDCKTSKSGIVHHIDGIKSHNDSENLILLCNSCHAKIHFTTSQTSPVIMAFRNKLLE